MMKNFKGTRDFFYQEYVIREKILFLMKKKFKIYGFSGLNTPAIEYTNTFFNHFEEDPNQKLIFYLAYKGGKKAALRYDLTIPLSRFVNQHYHEIVFPFKRYQIQKVWRADSPQFGRYREFYQCDIDFVHSKVHLINVAEILVLAYEVLSSLKLGKFCLQINNRRLMSLLISLFDIPSDKRKFFYILLDKLDKIGIDEFKIQIQNKLKIDAEKLLRIFSLVNTYFQSLYRNSKSEKLIQDEFIESINKIIGFSLNLEFRTLFLNLSHEIIILYQYIHSFLPHYSREEIIAIFEVSIFIVRGLTYYSGWIYEGTFFSYPHLSICGGGEYENLFKFPLKGIGISFGLDRIISIWKEQKEVSLFSSAQILVSRLPDEDISRSLEVLVQLRQSNLLAEIYPDVKSKLKKQILYALKSQIPILILMGKKELDQNQVTLKFFYYGINKGISQVTIPIQELIPYLIKKSPIKLGD